MSDWLVIENNEPPYVTEVKQDYEQLEGLMKTWELNNYHKPFTKNLVCLLGTTSSGKSSFVNHFFKIGVKKVALQQLDTHFTVIETVKEEEFKQLVGASNYKRKKIPESRLFESVEDVCSDKRRNVVYLILDTSSTLNRHVQFERYSAVFRKHELINSILINEYYVRGTDEEVAMRKNTILIDSPGFTAETQIGKLRGNLEILQHLYRLSDLTLFFVPSDSINLVASQIAMLELSILYAFQGENRFNEVLSQLLEKKDSSFSFSITDLFTAVVANLAGSKPVKTSTYDGTVYWDKVKFILSKIDRVTIRCTCNQQIRPEAQFFELGTTLGTNLKYLKPPVFDQCFAIALPEHQIIYGAVPQDDLARIPGVITADLPRLLATIKSLNFFDSYVVRLDAAIQNMCTELSDHINSSYWSYVSRSAKTTIDAIRARSRKRCLDRAGPSENGPSQ